MILSVLVDIPQYELKVDSILQYADMNSMEFPTTFDTWRQKNWMYATSGWLSFAEVSLKYFLV